jgi:hypothetical protein
MPECSMRIVHLRRPPGRSPSSHDPPMPTIYVPTTGAGCWRELLADPGKHWRPGRSAFELAVSWEAAAADGLPMPREVLDAFHAGGEAGELAYSG